MSEEPGSSSLERRYRRWMRAYPAAYRAEREEELVGVLLDAAAPGQQRPTAGEVSDLVRAGVVARFRGPASTAPVGTSAAAANLVAVVGTLILGVQALVVGVVLLVVHPEPLADLYADLSATPGWFWPWIWTLAALLLVAGRARPAMVAGRAAALAELLMIVAQLRSDIVPLGAAPMLFAFQSFGVVLGFVVAVLLSRPSSIERSLAGFGRRRLLVVVAAMAALTALTHRGWLPMGPPSRDPAMFAVQALVAVLCLIPGSVGGRRRDPVVRRAAVGFGALVVFALVSGGYRTPGIPLMASSLLGAVAAVALDLAVTAAIMASGVVAVRFARRLPARRMRRSA